jgi:nucleotide-binding universal stress UspA family protein
MPSGSNLVLAGAYGRITTTRRSLMMTTILVGTDSSSAADLAVEDAARLARDRGAELMVLLVRPDGDVRAAVDPDRAPDPGRYLSELTRRDPEGPLTTRIERGAPAARICEVAAEVGADTIVVGNRGTRGSWWRVKDSVPNLVLRHSPCSVFIVDTRRAQ